MPPVVCTWRSRRSLRPIAKAKRAKLEREAAAKFNGTSNDKLNDYAAFRAATEKLGPWHSWPERMRIGDLRIGDYDERGNCQESKSSSCAIHDWLREALFP